MSFLAGKIAWPKTVIMTIVNVSLSHRPKGEPEGFEKNQIKSRIGHVPMGSSLNRSWES
jgi:hypothetical protein